MTEQAMRVLEDVTESESFMDALKELILEEFKTRGNDLRAAVRTGQHLRAHEIEGELAVLDELPDLFKKHAAKAVRHRV